MDQALANRPYEVAGAKKHQRRLQPHRPLRGFKATASSCDDSQTAHATHSTPSPPHSRQDHETPTSPQTPDNKLHHRHAKIFKSPLRQTPPIVDQHSAGYSSSNPTLPCRFPCRGSLGGTVFAQRQQPLGGVVCGTRVVRPLGVGHESWHRTARSGTKRPLLVERPIRTVGRVAWPLRRGTVFAQR